MKKLIIVIIIVILLLPAKAIINSNLKAEQLDAYGIAGLFVTLGNKTKPSPPKPDVNPETEKCKCKNGKVSYDGGTSWTDCPCVNSKGKCDCGNTTESPEIDRVILITQPRICLPCRDVEKQVVKVLKNKAHEKSGWRVGSGRRSHLQILDLDNSEDMNEINQLEISFSAVPSFFKIKNGKVVNEHVGSMSYSEFLTFSGVKKKLAYSGRSSQRWTLNGQLRPSRESLINHLRLEHGLDWPFEHLTYEELLSIHNDDHNNMLGELNELHKFI